MAVGNASDFVVNPDQFLSGQFDAQTTNLAVFNEGSRGGMVLKKEGLKGFHNKKTVLQRVTNAVTRRDMTSNAAVTPKSVGNRETAGVKVFAKFGPISYAIGAIQLAEYTVDQLSFMLGQMYAEDKLGYQLDYALLSLEAALRQQAASTLDKSADGTQPQMCIDWLIDGRALFGDKSEAIVSWVGYSKPYHNLVKNSVKTDKIDPVAAAIVYGGEPATLGLPYIKTDRASLLNAGTPNTYSTLGLVPGAVTVTESEAEQFHTQVGIGNEQITIDIQGEFTFNVELKGFTWDIANGGNNPDMSTVGTGTNWDVFHSSVKERSGIVIITQ